MNALNNKLILKPYKTDGKVRANAQSGFAMVAQKTNLVGLEALADGLIIHGSHTEKVSKGSLVYFKEEVLHASQWSKQTFKCDNIKEPFVIGEATHVICVGESNK